jgi:hypothetical protein
LVFDQSDLVQVLLAGKYLTGVHATWGDGDWDAAPGGAVGNPPGGDGLFNQKDIVAAQQSNAYLTGRYASLAPGGVQGDDRHSIIYDAHTGELALDVATGKDLSSINIDSAVGIFTGTASPDFRCGGSDCEPTAHNIFKATFRGTFGSLEIGPIAAPRLSKEFILNDLAVLGSMGALSEGPVRLENDSFDLIYIPVPEPDTLLLCSVGLIAILAIGRQNWSAAGCRR